MVPHAARDDLDVPPERRALFFAFMPDPETAALFRARARWLRETRRLTGRLIAPDRYHMSLYGVGRGLRPDLVRNARAVAETLRFRAFVAEFDGIGTYGGSDGRSALALDGDDGMVGVRDFQETLASPMVLSGHGYGRPAFTPHVTLLYDRKIEPIPIEPIRWRVRDFVLIESLQGAGRYIELGRWRLD